MMDVISEPGKMPKYESHKNSFVAATDLQLKVRDIQLQMIDMQGNQERRMAMMNEQLSAKLDRAIAGLEQKQQGQN